MHTHPTQTRDAAKVGQTFWQATVWLDDGYEPWARTIDQREIRGKRSKGLAKAFVNATLRGLRNPPPPADDPEARPHYWGEIARGTYTDSSFDDPEGGPVADATWEPDWEPHGRAHVGERAYLLDDGTITWGEL